MSQSRITEASQQAKKKYYRKQSNNSSIDSNQSPPIKKKQFSLLRKNTNTFVFDKKPPTQQNCQYRRAKVCDGQRLSYEVIKNGSRQKRVQFLQTYAHDPFMRKKFQKSIQKTYSKSKQGKKKQGQKTPQKSRLFNRRITSFREQMHKQAKKTQKLIDNCKSLVQQLRKNRLLDNQQKYQQINSRKFHITQSDRFIQLL